MEKKTIWALSLVVFGLSWIFYCNQIKSSTTVENSTTNSQPDNLINIATASLPDKELANLYTIAIKQFIQSIQEKDKIKIDTLFINDRKNDQPDDFPDIKLPAMIQGCSIVIIKQSDSKSKGGIFRESAPFINLIGMENEGSFEFIFVTFYPEFKHKYDCYLVYDYDEKSNKLDLKKTRIEVLIYNKAGVPDHYSVYENGKHTGDKPIN
jgi:hypothetical protein